MNHYEENPFEDERVAQEWSRSVEGERGKVREKEIYPLLKAWASDISGIIVEIGSGQGICSQHLGSFDGNYVGIEPSLFLTERAVELYGNNTRLSFNAGNAYKLPLENETADGVFSVNVLFHLEKLAVAAKELSRILKSGSEFCIITSNPDSYEVWKGFFEDYTENGKLISGKVRVPINPLTKNNIYTHSMEEIIKSLEEAGLAIEHIEPLGTISKYPEDPLFVSIKGKKS